MKWGVEFGWSAFGTWVFTRREKEETQRYTEKIVGISEVLQRVFIELVIVLREG